MSHNGHMINRSILKNIKEDLTKKIVLLTGPRQSGKTTFSTQLSDRFNYLNYDNSEHKIRIREQAWDREQELIVFDELHKMDNWKLFLKGIFDVEGIPPSIVVTGSSKLDVFRKVGDSLAGRFFRYRMHPFDLKEVHQQFQSSADELLETMLMVGNFPEPFISGKETFYRRWKKSHMDIILRQDLIDLSIVQDIPKLEHLIEILKRRVGSTISYSNIARDIEKDPNTVKRWMQLLENLYIIFKVTPYSKNVARSLLKDSKYYFYDVGQVVGESQKLENLVACALLKEGHYQEDINGFDFGLHFLRTKDGKEIDFLTVVDKQPTTLIEVKESDTNLSPNFNHFLPLFSDVKAIQLVKNTNRNTNYKNGCRLEKLSEWLCKVGI
jgi:predicted AAA+ superfamily ATPase